MVEWFASEVKDFPPDPEKCPYDDMDPEDGPKLVGEERAAEMRRECETRWSRDDDSGWPETDAERRHVMRMLDQRWPRPEPEQDSRMCRFARPTTGYQWIGWLVPRTEPNKVVAVLEDQDRKEIEARLAKIEAEAEARQLRKKLGRDAGE